jgi:hypothetical protein
LLTQLLFTALYLESNPGLQNEYVKNFFEVEIKMDVLLLRMVLDVVGKTLKQVDVSQDAIDNTFMSNFNQDDLLNAISKTEDQEGIDESFATNRSLLDDSSYLNSSRSSQRGFLTVGEQRSTVMPKLDMGFARKELNAKLEQEEEDAFLSEDTSKWDVFKDAHKFEKRDSILEKRKKQRVDKELKEIRSHREIQEEENEATELKRVISRLKEKMDNKDAVIE